jgi:hypothetical protein
MELNGEYILRLAYRGLAVWGSIFLSRFSLLHLNQLQQALRGTLRYTLNRLNHGRQFRHEQLNALRAVIANHLEILRNTNTSSTRPPQGECGVIIVGGEDRVHRLGAIGTLIQVAVEHLTLNAQRRAEAQLHELRYEPRLKHCLTVASLTLIVLTQGRSYVHNILRTRGDEVLRGGAGTSVVIGANIRVETAFETVYGHQGSLCMRNVNQRV